MERGAEGSTAAREPIRRTSRALGAMRRCFRVCLESVRALTDRRRAEKALRVGEERYPSILQVISDYAYTFRVEQDGSLRGDWVSESFSRSFGFTLQEIQERGGWQTMVFHEDVGIAVPHIAKVVSGEPDACELRFVTRSGEVRWVRDYARPVRDSADGRIVGIHGAAQDVTERVRIEESLRESEASLARAQALTQLGSWEVDLATNRGTWSAEMYRIFGVDPALPPPPMKEFLDMLHPDDRREFMRAHNNAARTGTAIDIELRSNPGAGKIRWFQARAQAMKDAEGRIVRLVGTTQDISERKRAEEKIRQSNRRLRQLSQRLVQVQESERRQLARELHDEVGQLLTGLRFMLVRCRRGPAPAECLEDAATVVDDLIQKVRNLSLDLRPAMLDDLGLLSTLHWHLDRFMNQTGIKVAVKHDSELEERRFHADVETSAYRIIQEALTNVARHAGVTEATLRVEVDDRRLCIEVEDRGVGFDPAALLGGYTNGLSGMRERAELLGGELILTTKVGVGTRVSAVLPLAEQYGGPVSEPEVGQ